MSLDYKFLKAVEELLVPSMGTENIGQFLYSLIRMTRSWRLLEVGLGYSTPFMAKALVDAVDDHVADMQAAQDREGGSERRGVLLPRYFTQNHCGILHAIDDFSLEETSAPKVMKILKNLGLDSAVKTYNGDFRGMGKNLEPATLPLDLIWFDCGGPPEYVDFMKEFWPLLKPDGGMLILHFTYWQMGGPDGEMLMGSIANEIKRQQAMAGLDARFEVLSLVEPHKRRQGSVTMIRRLGWDSSIRNRSFEDDVKQVINTDSESFPAL